MSLSTRPHRIVALAYPGMSPFELSIVIEVFGLPRPELDVSWWYSVDVAAVTPGRVPAIGGIGIDVTHGLEAMGHADTVIIPGWPVGSAVPGVLADAVREANTRGVRLVSICSGAFVLAAAGVLDGRPAATHWQYAATLAQRHPAVRVEESVLYVDDGNVLTSAGSAAGLDLCLHLIRCDHGAGIANQVARRLVITPHRSGGQAQYVESTVPAPDDESVNATIGWLGAHLVEASTVDSLAARAHLSPRHFARRFKAVTGETPIDWLIAARVAASLPMLESGGGSVAEVAQSVGFATDVTFRHHFRRRMQTTPTAYRRAFRA